MTPENSESHSYRMSHFPVDTTNNTGLLECVAVLLLVKYIIGCALVFYVLVAASLSLDIVFVVALLSFCISLCLLPQLILLLEHCGSAVYPLCFYNILCVPLLSFCSYIAGIRCFFRDWKVEVIFINEAAHRFNYVVRLKFEWKGKSVWWLQIQIQEKGGKVIIAWKTVKRDH